ncbi:unnamed protein product [Blepharisma stoltei]|uniref:Uncharacterized protein n=1 Tax=Blepharisma stoltei TaxID=1481888 RepID=A0AAU9K540_9CILI|nr:unnamed protein product [Blepharisma stoltei]
MIMKLFVFIVTLIASEEFLKEFGTIYLTVNESKTLKLHDYYSFNEIDFYISNTNMTENDIKLKHNSSLNLISHIPSKVAKSSQCSTKISKRFAFINLLEGIFFTRYFGNEIFGYFLDKNTEKLEELWKISINQNTIYQVTIIRETFYYLILATKNTLQENEIYVISIEEMRKPGIPFKLELWDIKYLEELKISTVSPAKRVMAIFGRFKSGRQIVFLYNVSYSKSVHLIYSFDYYIGSGDHENADLNIVGIILIHSKLLLLDSKLGLFIYDFLPQYLNFHYSSFIDLRKYGTSYSMHLTENNKNSLPLTVSTDIGVVFISQYSSNIEFHWINTYDAFGFLASIQYAISQPNWMFSQAEINTQRNITHNLRLNKDGNLCEVHNSYYLMVYEASEIWNRHSYQNIVNFNLDNIIGESFDPYGEWMICIFKNKKFYIRNDYDGIKLFLLEAEDWSMEIWGNHSYYIEIIGKSNHKAKKGVKKSLNVISLPIGSYEIYKNPNYPSPLLMEIYIDYEYHTEIQLSSMFSGPNLIYSIENINMPDNFFANFSISESKILVNEIILPKNVEMIRLDIDHKSIAYNIKNEIFFSNLDNMNRITVLSNHSNVYNFLLVIAYPTMIAVFETENSASIISLCSIYSEFEEEILCRKTYLKTICNFTNYLRLGALYIICADHESIYIYNVENEMHEEIIINKELLNLRENLSIIDIKSFGNIQAYLLKLRISIHCNYGIILVEIGLPGWDVNYKIINNFSGKIEAIASSLDYIYIAFSDSTIGIYDVFLQHKVTLGPHISGGVKYIDSSLNILSLQIGNRIAIYDWNKSIHDSLLHSFTIKDSCKLIANGLISFKSPYIPILCQFSDKNVMELYQLKCNTNKVLHDCFSLAFINLKINQNSYIENEEQEGSISIFAKNEYYQSKSEIKFIFHTNASLSVIWIDNRKIEKNLKIPYNKKEKIDLSEVFHGHDAKVSMLINNRTYENTDNNYFPAYFRQNFEEIVSIQLPTCDKSSDQVLVGSKLIVTAASEFIIFDTSYEAPKVDAILNFKDYINANIANCKDLDAIQIDESIILIFSICLYGQNFTLFWNERETLFFKNGINSLLIIEYDFIKKISLKTKILNSIPSFLDVKAVKLNNHRFEIFLYESFSNGLINLNNYILRYKGTLEENAILVEKSERIDFFSLEISEFSISAIDFVLSKFGPLYLYIIDDLYGLVIIQVYDTLPAKIVGGLKHPDSSKFASLCICQNNLYIVTRTIKLYEYSINETLDIKLIKSFYPGPKLSIDCMMYSKLLLFQEDCKYIIFANLDISYAFLYVWYSDQYFDFSLRKNDDVLKFNGVFLKNNAIAYLDTLESKLKIYSLNSRFIEIPAMSKENYESIVEKWGTDEFQIQLCMENLDQKVTSEVMILKRSINENEFLVTWWIWLLICCAVTLVIAMFACVFNKYKKRNSRKISIKDEGVMMEEIK